MRGSQGQFGVGSWLLGIAVATAAICGMPSRSRAADDLGCIVLDVPGRAGNPRNSEGSFIALKDGRILFAYSRYRGAEEKDWADHATADIAARTSDDGGRTWSAEDRILVANEGACNVMSASLLRLQDGRIALFYLRKNSWRDCRLWMRTSADEAATWSDPVCCIPAPGYFVVNNDRVIQLASGRIVVPAAQHRMKLDTDTMRHDAIDARGITIFFLSDDGGKTWRESRDWLAFPGKCASGLQEPGVIERRDGTLYGWCRTEAGHQYETASTDGGLTWSVPRASRFRAPCSPLSMKRMPATGQLLAVWNDHSRMAEHRPTDWKSSSWGRTPLSLALSDDDGVTWCPSRDVETDADRGFCYTAIHFTDDAVLLAYCCGGRTRGVLQDLCIRRIPLDDLGAPSPPPAAATPPVDRIRQMQVEAEAAGHAAWGHWGDQPQRYAAWSNHSNRLIPVYAFGMSLDAVAGGRSVYRDESRLRELYGRLPERTLNPEAAYFDQTDVCRLQEQAAAAGKKRIILLVFDGMDWHTTRTAAIAASGSVAYTEGRGTGFAFQDYRGTATDFGFCVTSPANDGTKVDVDAQAVRNPGGETPGGYDSLRGGSTPWDPRCDLRYLIGRDRDCPHAVTDSAASATSLCAGRKTYNDAINVDPAGGEIVPLARRLQARGWAVGAVSSVPVSHATPACAYANNVSRDDYQDIARDQLGEPSIFHRDAALPGLDVLIGGGFGVIGDPAKEKDQGRNFEPGNKYVADSTRRAIDVAHGGRYRVVERTAGRRGGDLLAEAARDAVARKLRLFGFFGAAEGHLPFRTADGDYNPAGVVDMEPEAAALRKKYGGTICYSAADQEENPALDEMAVAALDVLSTRGPFWLMVEAGDVDWASHANNIDTAIGAVMSGDAAFRAIVGWIERHGGWDDTVMIVTSDHGHLFVLTDPAAFAR